MREKEKQTAEEVEAKRIARDFRLQVEDELNSICEKALHLLDQYLIPKCDDAGRAKVFYYKLKGDFLKYRIEISPVGAQDHGGKRESLVEEALKAYKAGRDVANSSLSPAHPVRLESANNLAVFYFEVLLSPERAIQLSREAIESAVNEREAGKGAEFEDEAKIVLQLLKENLDHWTGEVDEMDE